MYWWVKIGGIQMDVKVCKNCKKIFQYIAGPEICPRCKQLEEDMFQKVKTYLRENPGESMHVVSEETEVSVALIEKFLRQGRLEVSPDSPITLTCEMCGRKITSGRFCSNCKGELTNHLNEAKKALSAQKSEKTSAADAREKMRFLKSDSIRR